MDNGPLNHATPKQGKCTCSLTSGLLLSWHQLSNMNNIAAFLQSYVLLSTIGDGHCFLYAVITSFPYQLPYLPKLNLHQLKCDIFQETLENAGNYIPFCVPPSNFQLFSGIQKYLVHKSYSNQFGDLVVGITANILKLNIVVWDENHNGTIDKLCYTYEENDQRGSLNLHRKSDHYSAVAPRLRMVDPPPGSCTFGYTCTSSQQMRTVSTTNSSTTNFYDRNTLLQINNSKHCTLKRSVRKVLFNLRIWKPQKTGSPTHKGGLVHKNLVNIPCASWDFPRLLNCNAQSVLPKIDELQVLCENHQTDVVAITESWLSKDIASDLLCIDGYQDPIRNDREGRRGGGVVAYIREGLSSKHWKELEAPEAESLWLTIYPKRLPRHTSVVIVGVIYHPHLQQRMVQLFTI